MKKRNFSWALTIGLSLGWTAAAQTEQTAYTGYHQDYRQTPKFITGISEAFSGIQDPKDVATAYLKDNAEDFKWQLTDLEFVRVQPSLIADHVRFAQRHQGELVNDGEVVISVERKTGAVIQVYNNFFPGGAPVEEYKKQASLSKDRAFEIAWQDLKVHGDLTDRPQAELRYVVSPKGQFKLAYIVSLHVQAPFGAWQHIIGANTGEVMKTEDTRLERKRSDMAAMRSTYKGSAIDRNKAFEKYETQQRQIKARRSAPRLGEGSGLVFDPDPRTSLGDNSLHDESSAELFDAAYFTKALRDLTVIDGTYHLQGPWITIKDFESPATAPSTTSDGIWSARRGEGAFNDVMTYYHIDANQRYMQSLGFNGDKMIQGASIEVDADGVHGADNSHYIPGSNRMAFGHGCIDDNEDADVILHEYGHAINHSINSNWRGGDTGAMGEGFGDYWAGSYSLSTSNGASHDSEKVFNWDGHGEEGSCWPGRVLNAHSLRYDHEETYGPHQGMPDGHQTDELWSTPIFQSLLTLLDLGVPRDEVDQIILEAQFGLSAGVKMRDMAHAIVATARRLHPEGPHARIFTEKFVHHAILDAPKAILTESRIEWTGTGANRVVDPGETVGLTMEITNNGTMAAANINTLLSSTTPGVTMNSAISRFPAVAPGQSATNVAPYTFTVEENFACGDVIDLNLGLNFDGGAISSANLPLRLQTGVPTGSTVSDEPMTDIPDADEAGIEFVLNIDSAAQVSKNLKIDVNIEHSFSGDLSLTLISPNGTEVLLRHQKGGSDDDVVGTFGEDLQSEQPLDVLAGQPIQGSWTLRVSDLQPQDRGKVISWGITDIAGYICD